MVTSTNLSDITARTPTCPLRRAGNTWTRQSQHTQQEPIKTADIIEGAENFMFPREDHNTDGNVVWKHHNIFVMSSVKLSYSLPWSP